MRHNIKHGFSLVELLIGAAIVSASVAAGVSYYQKLSSSEKIKEADKEVKTITESLADRVANMPGSKDEFLQTLVREYGKAHDPWGNQYRIMVANYDASILCDKNARTGLNVILPDGTRVENVLYVIWTKPKDGSGEVYSRVSGDIHLEAGNIYGVYTLNNYRGAYCGKEIQSITFSNLCYTWQGQSPGGYAWWNDGMGVWCKDEAGDKFFSWELGWIHQNQGGSERMKTWRSGGLIPRRHELREWISWQEYVSDDYERSRLDDVASLKRIDWQYSNVHRRCNRIRIGFKITWNCDTTTLNENHRTAYMVANGSYYTLINGRWVPGIYMYYPEGKRWVEANCLLAGSFSSCRW